jgi:pimeloyl-ACP methyl ester carboxylesterase
MHAVAEDHPVSIPGVRRHGSPPFRVTALHGGPGVPGAAAPLARHLAARRGVLEPLQLAASLTGQLDELAALLAEGGAEDPVTLVGHSWGAVLGYLFAAHHPDRVRRLILVASAPFDEASGAATLATRLARLDADDRRAAETARAVLADGGSSEPARAAALAEVDRLFGRVDSWDPTTLDVGALADRPDVYDAVWHEVRAMRVSGELVALGTRIRCPVLGIHGDYDTHPADGVRRPLEPVLADFRWAELAHCGHTPWLEREAAAPFYALVEAEVGRDEDT